MISMYSFNRDGELQKTDSNGEVEYKKAPYIVMEFLPHKDLHDFVFMYDNFSEPVCRYYFLQLLSVVHFLHSNNVYHRDIKPANMLLDNEYNLRLCDFGAVGVAYD
jgi:serine/threonine protein kinase